MFHKGRHSGPPRFLRRDKAFKAALAREYKVEKVPERFQQAMEETYRKLPDSVPAAYRPVRRVLRQTATVFAVLVLTFVALLGVNTTYPQLAEALPGLGPVFHAINGGRHAVPDADVIPEPTATPQPTFQPVVMSSTTYSGNMTITDAWSDGRMLFLEMELELKDGLLEMMRERFDPEKMDPYEAELDMDRYSYGTPLYSIWPAFYSPEPLWRTELVVNGLDMNSQSEFAFSEYKDGDTIHAQAIATFGQDIEVDRELDVEFALPDFYVSYYWDMNQLAAQYSPNFYRKFTVPVDRSNNFALNYPVSQNGASLAALDFAPSYVSVEVELPYLGTTGETQLPLETSQEWGDSFGETLLGAYPELTMTSGKPVSYGCVSQEVLSLPSTPAEPGTSMKLRFTFLSESNPQEQQGPLRLTFYELPPQNIFGGTIDEIALRRVVAEFTIEPSTNQVMPTENYRRDGRDRVDITRDPATLVECGFVNGFRVLTGTGTPIAQYVSPSGWSEAFEIITRVDSGPRPLIVKGYLKDEVAQTFLFTVGGEEDTLEDDTGTYYGGYTFSANGKEYMQCSVALHIPSWPLRESSEPISFDRVELVDAETDLTLIPDLTEAVKAAYRLDPPEDADSSSRLENETHFGTEEGEGEESSIFNP